MQSEAALKHGDFTQLAEMYALHRPGYCQTVLDAIIGITNKNPSEIDFADVGAGTGIWTRMVATKKLRSATAVEPNDEMRKMGEKINTPAINWQTGSGENTGLADESIDLITMASSFHWVDFDRGTTEFHRVLRKGGHFVALWNPRYIQNSPLLIDIENKIYELAPNIKRISSGKSAFVDQLSEKLKQSSLFSDVVYIEGEHSTQLKSEQYLGAWLSVNDVRSQLGEVKFTHFINYVKQKIAAYETIDCSYLTRAWIAKKK